MSSSKQFPDAFASLLAGLLTGGKGTMLRVEPREGESIEDAIARTEAEHREVCQGCAEAYEAEQFEAKKKAHDEAEKAARREAKAARKASRQETDGDRYEGKRPELSAPYGAGENSAPKRTPIGYMAFHVLPDGSAKAIPPSFNPDRTLVEAAMNEVEQHPIAMILSAVSGTSVEVRPVFAE